MDEADLLKNHKILDDILVFVSKSERDFEHFGKIRKQLGIDASDDLTITLVNFMINKGVVDPIKHSGFRDGEDFVFITKNRKTSLFIEKGGFRLLHEKLQNEAKRLSDNQVIEDAKLRSDARLSKLQADHFWKIFSIALVGGLVGLFTLTLELEDRGYISLPIEFRKDQSGQVEISASSNSATIKDSNFIHTDTLNESGAFTK